MFEEYVAGFATPFEPFDQDFFEHWVCTLMGLRIESFLNCHRHSLPAPLTAALEGVAGEARELSPSQRYEFLWHPAVGQIAAPAGQGDPATLARASQLALRASQAGLGGYWSARFDQPQSLFFADRLVRGVEEVSVASSGVEFRREGEGSRFQRRNGDWELVEGVLDPAVEIGNAAPSILLLPHAFGADGRATETAVTEAMAKQLHQGLEFIGSLAPEYSRWIKRILRVIVVLRGEPGCVESESLPWLPGTICMSWSSNPVQIGETFLHEVAHNYLYVVESFGPVTRGSGEAIYWSPPKQTFRPLRAILLAYHAFANVLVYSHRALQSQTSDDGRQTRQLEESIAQLDQWRQHFETILSSHSDLTASGQTLVETLMRHCRKEILADSGGIG